jgi:hypothetical protein
VNEHVGQLGHVELDAVEDRALIAVGYQVLRYGLHLGTGQSTSRAGQQSSTGAGVPTRNVCCWQNTTLTSCLLFLLSQMRVVTLRMSRLPLWSMSLSKMLQAQRQDSGKKPFSTAQKRNARS